MATLSVFVVTFNEEHNLRECLESIAWADEIVVVDSLSTDKTVEIAKEFTSKVIVTPWEGCGPQKLKAFNLTTGDWVMCLDADERVTPELKQEILDVLKTPHDCNGYEIPFESYYCGKRIRFGDWLLEKHLRLFRRSTGTIVPRLVHFRTEVKGKIGFMKGKIIHYSYPNLEAVIRKMNTYSTDGAIHKQKQGRTSSVWKALLHGFWTFFRGFFIKLGFLDGLEGFLLAISNAEGCYYRYLKLYYLTQR